MHLYTEEYIFVFALNTKGKILGVFELAHGTVNECLFSPREIFIRFLLIGAESFVIAHNLPSQVTTATE